jgi:taurine dioxygenase
MPHFELEPLTPRIGSEIRNLDLATANAETLRDLRAALAERMVLVVRDQKLDRVAHKRVARAFGTGELQRHLLAAPQPGREADPEVLPIATDAKSKYTAGEGWHSDVTCEAAPIAASLLYLTELPEFGCGGDTLFADMHSAWEGLSEPVRDFCERLSAVHDGALPWKSVYGIDPKPGQSYPKTTHPVVVRHPETGRRTLFVNRGFTTHIAGVSKSESAHLLELLFRHIETSPDIQVRVRWQPNTLVIWDNPATQHHAVWDYYPQSRYGERVSALGSKLEAAEPAKLA